MIPIYGIDPGTRESALVDCDFITPSIGGMVLPNAEVLVAIDNAPDDMQLAIEMFDYLGQTVGRDVFTTLMWIGRFIQAYYGTPLCGSLVALQPYEKSLVHRRDIKMHLCGTMRAKDKNIRQAIIDRFGGKEAAIGKKKTPGPLYGVKSHEWQALAVALTYHDNRIE